MGGLIIESVHLVNVSLYRYISKSAKIIALFMAVINNSK
jgi:hypothetical protein